MSNNTTSAPSTTEGFQIDTSMNMTFANSTGLSLDKGNTTIIDNEEVYRVKAEQTDIIFKYECFLINCE